MDEIATRFEVLIEEKVTNVFRLVCVTTETTILIHSASAVKRIFEHFQMYSCITASSPLPLGTVIDKTMEAKTESERA